ncbi:MAG: hypothetical protein ACI3YK_07335 [Eubacteriales bacterium]
MLKKTAAVLLAIFMLLTGMTGCSSPKVLRLGDFEVSYDMLRYFSCNYMKEAGHTQEEYENSPELQKELEDQVYGTLKELAAYSQLAEQYKIELTSAEKNQIEKELTDLRANYASDEEYEQALEEQYLTEDVYRQIQEIYAVCDRLYECLLGLQEIDDDTIRKDIDSGNWFAAEYLCVVYTSDDEDAKRLELMEEILSRAKAGESLSALADEYRLIYGLGEVTYDNLEAFTYYSVDVSQQLEDTVTALEIGEYSEVCRISNSGFFIAHRLPLEQEYIEDNFDSVFWTGYQTREFFRTIEQFKEGLEVDYKSKYEDLKLWMLE